MSIIIDNFLFLGKDIVNYVSNDIKKNKDELEKLNPKTIFDWTIKIVKKINQKLFMNYPKLSIITLVASFIFNIYFFNFFNFFSLLFSCYLFYQNRKYYISILKIYYRKNISEFITPYERKKAIIMQHI